MARSDSSDNNDSDSSKKVAKAAKAGATPSSSSGREDRNGGFRLAMFAVIALGTALVAFSWNTRDASALQPTFSDHWHVAYGIYDCTIDGFQAPLQDPGFPTHAGIHTHSDGVIHAHPFSSTATGNGATLETFLEATDAQIEDDAFSFTGIENRPALAEGTQCNGEDAILQVVTWAPGETEPTEVFVEDLGGVRFLADQQALVIALAPEGFDVPRPPDEAVEAARASSPNVFDTFGINDLDGQLEAAGIGFDEDGNLIDAEGEVILDAEGSPITRDSLEVDPADADEEEGDE